MTGNSLFGLLFSLLLVFNVFFAGCSDESTSDETLTPLTAHPEPKYRQGDIIATAATTTASTLYLILAYDAAADEYTRAFIEKDTDGTWGHRPSNRTERSPRTVVEKVYTVRVGRIAVSSVPVITRTFLPEPTQTRSGNAPSIVKISPAYGTRDTRVSLTITGSDFQDGATVRLIKAGETPVTASGVSVTPREISCFFNLAGKSDGSYNLVVTNPDGQSDSEPGAFAIGAASPVIAGMYPATAALNDTVSVSISGQNFRNEVKVSFTKGSAELVCDNPLSLDSARISCNLDLATTRGASAGEWTVSVLNIRDQQKGTWVKKFVVSGSTPEGD
jgi:hypothetical protein